MDRGDRNASRKSVIMLREATRQQQHIHQQQQQTALAQQHEPESLRKLRALRERITREYEQEKKDRIDAELAEPVMPLSLATEKTLLSPNKQTQAQQPHHGLHPAQVGYGEGHVPIQNDPREVLREKINLLKVDKTLQRELDSELDGKFEELGHLRAQNRRLREIINLRESSNVRKEQKLESEIGFLKNLMDDICVDSRDHQDVIAGLREMNDEVQARSELLRPTIEEQAESERLALIRTYRVRIRDLKAQLGQQEKVNLEGASAWIARFEMLDKDRAEAAEALAAVEAQNDGLKNANREIKAMKKHQDEQRDSLTHRIAVVKRENKRFQDHINVLEARIQSTNTAGAGASKYGEGNSSASKRRTPSQPSLHTTNNTTKTSAGNSSRQKNQTAGAQNNSDLPYASVAEQHQIDAIVRMKSLLESLRKSLKQVRTAHIELMQERTELEIFMRRCVEDVRNDMYKFTIAGSSASGDLNRPPIVTHAGHGTTGAGAGTSGADRPTTQQSQLLLQYGANERKQLMGILNSKLQVLTLLHQEMFPNKVLPEMLGERLLQEIADQHSPSPITKKGDASAVGSPNGISEVLGDTVLTSEFDSLWSRWKDWVRSTTPTVAA